MAVKKKVQRKQVVEEQFDEVEELGAETDNTESQPKQTLTESQYYAQRAFSIVRGNSFKVFAQGEICDREDASNDNEREVIDSMIKSGLLKKTKA